MMRYIFIALLTVLVIGCTAEQEQIYREKYEPIFKNETQKIVQNTTQQIVENLSKQNEELKQQLENINKMLSSSQNSGGGGGGGFAIGKPENITSEERWMGFQRLQQKCLAEAQKLLQANPEILTREANLSPECPKSRVLLKDEVEENYLKALANIERTLAEIRYNESLRRQNETQLNQSPQVKNYFNRLAEDNETVPNNTTNNGSVNIGDEELNITINPVDFNQR